MKLIKLKCSNCGANLETEETTTRIKCNYCNATTIIDDEIIKIEHKIINDDIDRKQKNASTFLYKLKKYNKAKQIYLELSEETPEDPTIYKGIILSETENFTKLYDSKNDQHSVDFRLLNSALQTYKLLENNQDFEKKYRDYIEVYNEDMIEKQHSKKEKEKEAKRKRMHIYFITLIIIFCFSLIMTIIEIME